MGVWPVPGKGVREELKAWSFHRRGRVAHTPAPEQDSRPQGQLSAAAPGPPAPSGTTEMESRRTALWFVFLLWGEEGLKAALRIHAFLFKLK